MLNYYYYAGITMEILTLNQYLDLKKHGKIPYGIVVAGSSKPEIATRYAEQSMRLGELIAERGYALVTGAGEGITSWVIKGYKQANGRLCITCLPDRKVMKKKHEKIGPRPNIVVETKFGYRERSKIMVMNNLGVIALGGPSEGTVYEVYTALDHKIPVSVVNKTGISILKAPVAYRVNAKPPVVIISENPKRALLDVESYIRRMGLLERLVVSQDV
jgi:uncharacterized protein (TIGR00725 family)